MGLLDEIYTQQPGLLSSGNRLSGLLGEPINPIARRNRLADFGAKLPAPNRLSVLDMLDAAALPTMMIPGVGDVTGTGADLNMYLNDPSSRTAGNYALSMAGLLPFVPNVAGSVKKVTESSRDLFHDMPLYHGMAGDIDGPGFSLDRGGDISRSPVGRLGVSAALDPQTAEEFARLAASGRSGEGAAIVPLVHRADRPGVIELRGDEMNHEMAATIQDAWDSGYDSLMIKNYTTPEGRKSSFIIVKDPAQLRSPHAKFNLKDKNLNNLLAGLGAVAVGSVASGDDAD